MAKVKNQIYDGSEESYTDAAGRVHSVGELIRQTMTDSYPLPSLNPTGVIRKSPRTSKPATRGRGTPAQGIWRDCFQQCAEQWNALPDVCPDPAPCPEITSKKSIWDAKQLQGVMCSYFDLFMGCCLSSCTEISITGPGGHGATGGQVTDPAPCWPCPSPCKASTLSIGYTSGQMLEGESQTLWVVDSEFGDNVPCCDPEDLEWSIGAGGGYINPPTGLQTLYTAPDLNEDCEKNPAIELRDCCGRLATVNIAVSKDLVYPAYLAKTTCSIIRSGGTCQCWCGSIWDWADDRYIWHDCVGRGLYPSPSMHCGGETWPCAPEESNAPCTTNVCPMNTDMRNAEQRAEGCCPEALL